MRPHLDIGHQGNIAVEGRTRMSFDQNSISHLMSILIDLYSDPEQAVVREYSTNALDSHKAAGNTDPINIVLPTKYGPIFKVIDHGIGMSVDDVHDIYSLYGASTKRDSDEEVGMLGLGAKSALTYTSQFTLITRKGGTQATVLITREHDGAGAVQVMDTCATDERDGVEVQIPVKDVYSFNQTAREFFKYWEPGLALIDGEPTVPFKASMKLDDDVLLTQEGQDVIVMGNVPYPVPPHVIGLVAESRSGNTVPTYAVVRVPIGVVDFTPSREALQMTKRTEETLHDIREFIKHRSRAEAQIDINAAPDHREALKRSLKWRRSFWTDFTYRGQDIPASFIMRTEKNFIISRRTYHGERSQKIGYKRADDIDQVLVITGYRAKGISKDAKAKAQQWCEERGLDHIKQIMVTGPDIFSPWIDPCNVVRWDDLRLVVLPDHVASQRKSTAGKYRTLNHVGQLTYSNELEEDAEYLWIGSHVTLDRYDLATFAKGHGKQIIVVQKQNLDKFKDKHPDIKSFQLWIAKQMRTMHAEMTDAEWYHRVNGYEMDSTGIRLLNPEMIMDPDIKALVADVKGIDTTKTRSYDTMLRWAKSLMVSVPTEPNAYGLGFTGRLRRFLADYPLMALVPNQGRIRNGRLSSHSIRGGVDLPDFYSYMNALYLSRAILPVDNNSNPTP
jgi:hypothetical protein